MPEAAISEKRNGLPRRECCFAKCAVRGPSGTAERRPFGSRDGLRHTHKRRGGSQRVIAESALQRIAEVSLLRTKTLAARDAPLANSARHAQECYAGAVARSPAGYSRSDGFHAPDPFVPQRERCERQLFQPSHKKVRVTYPASLHPQEDLSVTWLGKVLRFYGNGTSCVGEYGGSGAGAAHAEEYNGSRPASKVLTECPVPAYADSDAGSKCESSRRQS